MIQRNKKWAPRLPERWDDIKTLVSYLSPYKNRLALGLLAGVAYAGVNSGMLLIIKHIGDTAFQGKISQGEMMKGATMGKGPAIDAFIWMALLIPAVMVVRSLLTYANVYCLTWVSFRALRDMRRRVFLALLSQSMDFYNKSHTGRLISRVLSDTGTAQSAIVSIIGDLVKQPLTAIGAVIALLYIDWKFTLLSLVLFPICIIPVVYYGKRIRKASRILQNETGLMSVILQESFSGIKVIKSFSREDYQLKQFDRSSEEQFSMQLKNRKNEAIVQPMIESVSALGVALALFYVYFSHLTVGSFIALLGGMFLLYDPVKNISKIHISIQNCIGSATNILELLSTVPAITDKSGALILPKSKGHISFNNVNFSYSANGEYSKALSDFNLEIAPGTKVALVGASGAGKSTVLSLLMRFYDPQLGQVLIDGYDIKEITQHSLHDQIGIVTQDNFLFHDTIAENIRFGRLDATREEIEDAARLAHAHEFIMAQPHGYKTVVGDKGSLLSGGQQQRLSIARALLKGAPILLLDEATSALDSESEKMIQDALEKLAKGRTVVAIAHRLSTILGSDMIVVMDQGRIVATGTHAELLSSSEHYAKLYSLQFREAA